MADGRDFYGWKLLIALSAILSVNLGFTYVGASVTNAAMPRPPDSCSDRRAASSMIRSATVGVSAAIPM